MGVEHTQGSGITYLYLANTGMMGHGSVGKRGYGLARGGGEKGEFYYGIPAQALLRETSCWDDIPPKIGN